MARFALVLLGGVYDVAGLNGVAIALLGVARWFSRCC